MNKIQIVGPGCVRCKVLAENTKKALEELGIACEIQKVTAIDEILSFGLLATPALVVDGEVKVSGKVLPAKEIKTLLASKTYETMPR